MALLAFTGMAAAPQSPGAYLVVYSAQADAAGDAATLQKVIEVVMFSADRFEMQLSDKDAF